MDTEGSDKRGARGRGGGQSPEEKKSYQELGKEQLRELYPTLSPEDLFQTYRSKNYDMERTLRQLCADTGRPFIEDTQELRNPESGFSLKEFVGDLFSCDTTASLGHCVSVDLAMGKGIAIEFKTKFGGVVELKAQGKQIGEVAVLKRDKRYVYYLITKESYWHKPTYSDLRKSLECLLSHCVQYGVKKLAIPRIGCGLDGLFWSEVKSILQEIFWASNLEIEVYRLPVS